YTPRGGSIDISVAATDGRLLLRVSDTGPGIPTGDQERVFERFVRLDPARAAGGSGLGLALARWIAEAHEGTLRVESSSPSGSGFVASLPAQPQIAGRWSMVPSRGTESGVAALRRVCKSSGSRGLAARSR